MPTTQNIFHGIKTNLLQSGTAPITPASTAIIGMVCTASDADAVAFPLDRPVLITNVLAALAKAGTMGTLASALGAIADQCRPIVVVVRVATAASADAQDALTIGNVAANGTYTGMQALLMAQAVTGYRPKILGTPGLTSTATAEAMAVIAQTLRGMHYSLIPAAVTVAAAVTDAATFGQREIELLWPECSEGAGYTEARALGLRAAIDQSVGWHRSLSNVGINNMTGTAVDVSWTLNDTGSDAGALNNASITTLVNNGSGWRFWGNRTCSSIAAYSFEVATRTSQALADIIETVQAPYVDAPMTQGLLSFILNSCNAQFRKLVAGGQLIGANAYFDATLNAAASLSAGQVIISYDFTPVAPMEGLTNDQIITDAYYANFGSTLTLTTTN